ncbi:peptide/nickel transport system ATP-binding protein, partial [Streptomyces sp. OspMP-M43]
AVAGGGRLVACHLPLSAAPTAPHAGPPGGAPVPAEEAR